MHSVGTEWLVDAEGCRPEALGDVVRLRELFGRVVAELGLYVVGKPQWCKFPGPGGVTGLALLSESHLACHTYPEHGVATFNLYCCRARPRWDWEGRLRASLGATRVTVRSVERARVASSNFEGERDATARGFKDHARGADEETVAAQQPGGFGR